MPTSKTKSVRCVTDHHQLNMVFLQLLGFDTKLVREYTIPGELLLKETSYVPLMQCSQLIQCNVWCVAVYGQLPCPVLKSSMLEFWKVQHFFVRHFVPRSIVRKGVLPKNRSLLWDWTPSHAQRIYKGQNSENPLRAITFDWSDLRTWFQRLWATFLMLFSGIPHLPTFRHVVCVTSRHVT